jgi:hypothetical protein
MEQEPALIGEEVPKSGQGFNFDIPWAIADEIRGSGAEGLQEVLEEVERRGEGGAYGDELEEENASGRRETDPVIQEGEGACWLLAGGGSHRCRSEVED